jgi:hypothetical protein
MISQGFPRNSGILRRQASKGYSTRRLLNGGKVYFQDKQIRWKFTSNTANGKTVSDHSPYIALGRYRTKIEGLPALGTSKR